MVRPSEVSFAYWGRRRLGGCQITRTARGPVSRSAWEERDSPRGLTEGCTFDMLTSGDH